MIMYNNNNINDNDNNNNKTIQQIPSNLLDDLVYRT